VRIVLQNGAVHVDFFAQTAMSSQNLTIVVVVAFGEPSVGKSLLLSKLAALNERRELDDEPFYVTIDEPTADAAICEQIKRVYEQTNAAAAGGSVDNASLVMQVQRMIMRRRVEQYKQFIDDRLASGMQRARLAGRKSLAIVCDGHTLTDSYLYVRSRIESGQLSEAQFLEHQSLQSTLLSEVASALRQPDAFVRLAIGDRSGATHLHRIRAYRRTETESGVPESEFARLAKHADFAESTMARRFGAQATRIVTDCKEPERVLDEFRDFLRTSVLGSATHAHTLSLPAATDLLAPNEARSVKVSVQ